MSRTHGGKGLNYAARRAVNYAARRGVMYPARRDVKNAACRGVKYAARMGVNYAARRVIKYVAKAYKNWRSFARSGFLRCADFVRFTTSRLTNCPCIFKDATKAA